RQLFEFRRFGLQPLEQRKRKHAPALLRSALDAAVVAVADAIERGRIADRQRPQHDRVNQREDGRGAADAQRERENGGDREHARVPELPQRVSDRARKRIHAEALDGTRRGEVVYFFFPYSSWSLRSRRFSSALSPGYQYSMWQFSQASSRFSAASQSSLVSRRLTMSSTSRPTLRSASIFAFHNTGSFSSFALICAGDSSSGSGPVLLFSSPGGANGRGILSRYTPSASITPPARIRAQSSSVFGRCVSVPLLVVTSATASKM